jgi:hypothetical protein
MSDENKKDVKVEDLAPKKDAKGGVARNTNSMDQNSALNQDSANLDQNRIDQSGATKNLD